MQGEIEPHPARRGSSARSALLDGGRPLSIGTVVPEIAPRTRPSSPALSLARAVLEQALHDLALSRRAAVEGQAARTAAARVEEWFRSRDSDWPFAFETVCAHLRLEPDAVRRAIGLARPGSTARPALRRSAQGREAFHRTAPCDPSR